MDVTKQSKCIFIGGRSGVGKSSVALEMSHQLAQLGVQHAVIEGDNLDLAYPEPWRCGLNLAELNLAAMWENYRAAGYRRLIYTNTVSVLEVGQLTEAMGGDVASIGVLLTASDVTARARLAVRETGSTLEQHIERSKRTASELDAGAGSSIYRVSTDNRTVAEIARQIIELSGWQQSVPSSADATRSSSGL